MEERITARDLSPGDSLDALTLFLHRAFKELAEQGLNVTAATQTVEITERRIVTVFCLLAELVGKTVGTALLVTSPEPGGPSAFFEPGVAVLGQFAVDPDLRGHGIGDLLLESVETTARENGFTSLALDTPQPASHILDYYERHGFVVIGTHQWPGKSYVSAVMAKPI